MLAEAFVARIASIDSYPLPKWIFDKVLSLVLVVVLAPVFVLVVLAVGLDMLLRIG